ncbi:DUF4097 domain-containing protein [Geodermatophilus sabuli]|uniref:DUF4097 domain-containing protein n=1 Tax=Geodermatophilus sabuli TaxID=1564158 RepID=A0A7K3W530_9ACTN|nr:DUF4097 family beta strand repeat-containing protein [Geodermatophilus sabuli]NEK59932.1 DUF4097 domain-containing protein [Geodermatophilus sabuli]
MPTFDTPAPVHARVDVSGGSLRVRAADRSDTVVEVHPSDPHSSADVQAAQQTRVEYAAGRLLISSPRRPRLHFFGGMPSVEIDVCLPADSVVEVSSLAGDVDCEGRLGDVRVDARYGDIRIDRAAGVHARTAAGDVTVAAVDGDADAGTAYGGIRVHEARGDLRLDSSCGDITVDRALGSVGATTRYGEVRIGQAVRGSLVLETAYGDVEAGVREGTAAWLDVAAGSGNVRNLLTPTGGPEDAEETVEIRARTAYGDIVIRRA